MKLIHYTHEEFQLEPWEYSQEDRVSQTKPVGLWVSVKGKYDWKWWSESENFYIECLVFSYEVKLKKKANILHLKTADDILNFTKEYPWIREQWRHPIGSRLCASYEIDWNKVKSKYQGIIIAPYQWDCRLSHLCTWYYGWDCASGCIWDLDCIKEFKLIESEK